MPSARARPLVPPACAALAASLGLALGVLAAWQAPEHQGAAVWAASLSVLALAWRGLGDRRGGPRAAAAFGGALLAFVPAAGWIALATLDERLTSESRQLGCGLGATMLALIGVPVGLATLVCAAVVTGTLFAVEHRWRDRSMTGAAATALAACVALAAWGAVRGVTVPSKDGYLQTLPLLGTAEALHLAPRTASAEPPKRLHHIDQAGVIVHRSCDPPLSIEGTEPSEPAGWCWISLADGPDPDRPFDPHWAGPVSSHLPLEIRLDDHNAAWIVIAGEHAFAFRRDGAMPIVLELHQAMNGPPRAWAWCSLLGAAAALGALALRLRRRRALADIDRATDGTVTHAGWIALEDGRTVRAPEGLLEGERVLVVAEPTAAAAYRDADLASGVVRGDRASVVGAVRSAMTADAVAALAAATLAATPLVMALFR